jgi:hypothetical protein
VVAVSDDAVAVVKDIGGVGTAADDLVDQAIESNGDLVLDFAGSVGARPFAQFTPYQNNSGVRCHHWTILSVWFEPMPERAMLAVPHRLRPGRNDDYPLRHFSTPWIRGIARDAQVLKLKPADATPFGAGAYRFDGGGSDGDA